MKVPVRLFGPLAELAGTPTLDVSPAAPTVGAVVDAVAAALPKLRLDPSVRFALNTDYAPREAAVREGDVVSLIPPVGGG
jgi:molybdopterin converting factor small subunit